MVYSTWDLRRSGKKKYCDTTVNRTPVNRYLPYWMEGGYSTIEPLYRDILIFYFIFYNSEEEKE
jgi:hypothetical protein